MADYKAYRSYSHYGRKYSIDILYALVLEWSDDIISCAWGSKRAVISSRVYSVIRKIARLFACSMLTRPRGLLFPKFQTSYKLQISILFHFPLRQVSHFHLPSRLRNRGFDENFLISQPSSYFNSRLSLLPRLSYRSYSSGNMSSPQIAPYGRWKSPLTADRLATCSISLHEVAVNVRNDTS